VKAPHEPTVFVSHRDDDDVEESFRAAVRSLLGADFSSRLALGSLVASVQGDAKYELIAREETAPRAGEMDLHLTGDQIEGHSANAAAFGNFVRQIAESVKIITRERMGKTRFINDLLIEPGPGSVRAIFRSPDPVPPGAIAGAKDDPFWSDPNQQSLALHHVALLLANAEPTAEDTGVVDALVESLPPKARPKLIGAVKSIVKQDWLIDGEFRQRGLGIEPISLSGAGAKRLRSALEVRERTKQEWITTGHFDGHHRSRGLSWFVPDGGEREMTVVVPTAELTAAVANLSTEPAPRVKATFSVISTHGPGEGDAGTRSFILEAVTEESEGTMPLDLG